MKTLVLTILTLTVVMLSPSMSMDKTDGMHEKADGMKMETDGMHEKTDSMKMETDGMHEKADGMKMKTEEKMK